MPVKKQTFVIIIMIVNMTIRKNVPVIISLLCVLLATPYSYAAFMDRVLVVVNEDVITQSEFDHRLNAVLLDMKDQGQTPPADLPKQLLDAIISDRLKTQEAHRRGIQISDAELNDAIRRFAQQQNISVPQLKQSLAASGRSFNQFSESVRDSLTISRLTEFYARSRVVVPEYEIDGFIAANNLDVDTNEYLIAQIMLSNTEENKDRAQDIRDQISQGLSFQEAVLKYSEATNAQEGGVLGWRTTAKLPDVFVQAVKDARPGDVSGVLETPNALHILKVLNFKGDRNEIIQSKVRHILISATSRIAKKQASKKLLDIRQRIRNGEDFDDLARIYSDDSVSAANGGDLGWVSPGQMVQPFEQVFEKMPLNEVSEPVETQFGVHILRVEDRRDKNISKELMRVRADNILRRQRADREFQQWIRELQEGAYVEHVADPIQLSTQPLDG